MVKLKQESKDAFSPRPRVLSKQFERESKVGTQVNISIKSITKGNLELRKLEVQRQKVDLMIILNMGDPVCAYLIQMLIAQL